MSKEPKRPVQESQPCHFSGWPWKSVRGPLEPYHGRQAQGVWCPLPRVPGSQQDRTGALTERRPGQRCHLLCRRRCLFFSCFPSLQEPSVACLHFPGPEGHHATIQFIELILGKPRLPVFPKLRVLTNDSLGHWANDKTLPRPSVHLPPAWMCWPLWQPSNGRLIKPAHPPGHRAAPGAILQMFDPQVPPGHGDLLVGICSSADDILKGILLLRDLCAL